MSHKTLTAIGTRHFGSVKNPAIDSTESLLGEINFLQLELLFRAALNLAGNKIVFVSGK